MMGLFYLTLGTKNFWIVNLSLFGVGFFILATIPLCFEFGVELTYPVAEVHSTGIEMIAT